MASNLISKSINKYRSNLKPSQANNSEFQTSMASKFRYPKVTILDCKSTKASFTSN